jgi:nitrogen fixation/metabolism regulation signal transduction histidine kinase
LFARIFFARIMQDREMPVMLYGIIFFTIPAVLLAFLAVSLLSLIRDLITRRRGSKFQVRLLAYFSLIVLFAAAPATIITAQAAAEFVQFWRSIDVYASMSFAQELAMNTYALQLAQFETAAKELISAAVPPVLPEEAAAVQDFLILENGAWESGIALGDSGQKLSAPPAMQSGFAPREIPRDTDAVRYVLYPRKNILRVITFSLGPGFDEAVNALENEKLRFDLINALQINVKPLLIFYYGVFFFPSILMTLIIALSFTRRIAQPIAELTEATRQVASGDFKAHIITRRNDELGLLVGSFNTMVQDLERFKAGLVKAEKISIWQSMAEQLAHEIKNPLTPIKLSAERVLRRWRNDPDRIGEILEHSMLSIIQETEMISTLLAEFRTLSKPLEPSQTRTNVRDLTEEIIAPYASSHPKVTFDIRHIAREGSVKIDPHRLGQALTNLIINGIDAMDAAGTIEIRTDLVKKREIRYCRLSVKDMGKGIPEAEKDRVFTPYFTTKTAGTGLGLPIVERIVQDHGGTIWFNSAEGAGTTFFIDLPLDETEETKETEEKEKKA